MINFELIYTFIEVAKTKNLTAVASKFSITQPALSQRIRSLEDHIGQALFIRNQGLELSAAGQELINLSEDFLKDANVIDNWIKTRKKSLEGQVNLVTTYGPVSYFFPNFLKIFLNKYPSIKLSAIGVESSPQVEEAVLSGKVHVGIVLGNCKKLSLKSQLLCENNFVQMVTTPDFPGLTKDRIVKEEIIKTRLIVHSDRSSRTMKKVLKFLGLSGHENLNIVRLPDMESCKRHALAGVGIGFVANIYIIEEIKNRSLVAWPDFKLQSPMNLISINDKYELPAVTTFKKELVEYCRKLDQELQ